MIARQDEMDWERNRRVAGLIPFVCDVVLAR